MKILNLVAAAQEIARLSKKPVLYLHLEQYGEAADDPEALFKAAPYLRKPMRDDDEASQAWADGYAFVICESAEEMEYLYQRTVGDDGPTRYNHYRGPGRVYALTINSKGQTENENT